MNNDSAHDSQPSSSLTPWHWGWSAAMATIVLVTLAFRYALPVRDGDLWWHMLYGKYFLENMTLIADHTIFSWTPTTNDTIYVTWLPDIFLYLLHKAAGLPGIFAFRYICMLVPVLGCFLYARKLKIATHPLTWLLCLLAVIMSYTAAFEKPEILSFVFMTLLAWNWWHIRSSGEEAWKNCYLFPLIMLVWVNTHGGFVFGAVFLVLIGLGELLNIWLSPHNALPPRVRKHLIIALLLAAITPLLNPYGFHYPIQLFQDLLPTQENVNYNKKIAAYASPFLADSYRFPLYADIVVIVILLLCVRNFKKLDWSILLANIVFAFLYTRFLRTTFYWVPIFLFSTLFMLALEPLTSRAWPKSKLLIRLFPVLIMLTGGGIAGDVLYTTAARPETYQWTGFGICDANAVSEAQYIKKYFPKSRIGNTYDQGAYLLWELWPQNTVFFDSRHFPYKNWSDEFFSFFRGNNIEQFTKKYPCDLWCVGLNKPILYHWFYNSPDWTLGYYGKNAAVFIRRDIPLPAGGPIVSPDLATIKNQMSAILVLTWALNIQDWDTAGMLLTLMRERFPFPNQRETTRKAAIAIQGTKAYIQQDYQQAADLFGSIYPEIIRSDAMYARSLIHLSATAWARGDGQKARDLNKRAWGLLPGYYMLIYNAGIMNWYDWRQETNHDAGGLPGSHKSRQKIDPALWKMQLHEFLKTAPHSSKAKPYVTNAQAMLSETFTGRPELMLPLGL